MAPPEDYTSHTHYSAADSDANIDCDTPAAEDTFPKELDSDSDTPYSYTPYHINVLVVSVRALALFRANFQGGGKEPREPTKRGRQGVVDLYEHDVSHVTI